MNILLTGITGVIGGALAEEFLKRGHIVTALGRPKDDQSFLERLLVDQSKIIQNAANNGQLVSVTGDMRNSNCDISGVRLSELGKTVDAAFHCAADIHFFGPDVYNTNVQGILNFLDLAEIIEKPVHIASTAYVCGTTATFWEHDLEEGEPRNEYERSKRDGEKHALVFWRKTHLPVSIYRIPIVVGSSKDGAIRNPGTGYYGFFLAFHMIRKSIEKMLLDPEKEKYLRSDEGLDGIKISAEGVITLPFTIQCSTYPLNLAPIDWVIPMMADLFEYKSPMGLATFNITNPAYNAPQVDDVINKSLEIMGFSGIRVGNVEPPENLTGIAKIFYRQLKKILAIFQPYIEKGIEIFISEQAKQALASIGKTWEDPPPFDKNTFRILLQYAEQHNFGQK